MWRLTGLARTGRSVDRVQEFAFIPGDRASRITVLSVTATTACTLHGTAPSALCTHLES